MKPMIIVHHPCHDGNAAAWVAHRYYGGECEIVRCTTYGQAPPDVKGRTVLIFDFSWSRDTMIAMHADAASIELYDHHKSARDDLEGLSWATFDMERSGAQLAWDRFYPGQPRPAFIDSVADRDLFRFERPGTVALHAYRESFPFTVASCQRFYTTSLDVQQAEGETILRYERRMVEEIASQAMLGRIGEYRVATVTCTRRFASNTGRFLLGQHADIDYALMFTRDGDGMWRHELRARKGGTVDVSEIARRYNGGGHREAAGFRLDRLLTPSPNMPDGSWSNLRIGG